MSSWEIGDLAEFIGERGPRKGWFAGKLTPGTIKRVEGIYYGRGGSRGLIFADYRSPHHAGCWCASQWRKVEPCAAEFAAKLHKLQQINQSTREPERSNKAPGRNS